MKKICILYALFCSTLMYPGEFEAIKTSYEQLIATLQNLFDRIPGPQLEKPTVPKLSLHVPTLDIFEATNLLPLKRRNKFDQIITQSGLKKIDGHNVFQVNVVDQFELATRSELGYAACGVIALYNALNMNGYIKTGNNEFLTNLTDINKAVDFVRKFAENQWATQEEMLQKLQLISENKIQGFDYLVPFTNKVLIVSSLVALNPRDMSYLFFATELRDQKVRQEIFKNLSFFSEDPPEFFYSIITANAEMAEERGHWYAITCIKQRRDPALNKKDPSDVTIVIMDSAPGGYHLEQNDPDETNKANYIRTKYLSEFLILEGTKVPQRDNLKKRIENSIK